ncbi:MAG: retroviral-like aspartic protease family protein [Chloroflexi bacterium]|nr:retroviral-like aspartic protease family protein [Chloroflexota bacterium]
MSGAASGRRAGEVHDVGVFNWPVRLDSMDGERSLEIEAMVDTGASYTVVPATLLRELGVTPFNKITVVLADGRQVEMDIGRAWATINGASEVTLVVFGEDNARALLGAYTLEGLRLAVDPHNHTLIPATTAWA